MKANIEKKIDAVAVPTTSLRKISSGTSASGVRLRWMTSAAASPKAAIASARMIGEVQASRAPPRVKTSIKATVALMMSAAPNTSRLWSRLICATPSADCWS